MKHFYFLMITFFGLACSLNAQNTVTVDGSANWIGFANVFELPANGGGYIFGSPWGVPDLKSVVDVPGNTVTVQPNFNTYADNPTNPFWVNQTTGEGNKDFEGNTFVEDPSLAGSELTFTGNVNSYTLDASYEAVAFIKVFNSNFSVLKIETAPLIAGEDFVVNYTNVEAADAVVQYGFLIRGANGNPANEAALGSVVIGEGSDCDQDGILNASDPVENYTVTGPIDMFTATTNAQQNCSFIVAYDPITPSNPCDNMDTFTITQTEGLPSGSAFPVGTTTNTFEIENAAGTMETYTFDVTVIDGTMPLIECSSDVVVSTDDNGNYTIEDYSGTASDNCDENVVVAQIPAAGTVISEGETVEISITATDEAGNVANCSFMLTADSSLSVSDISQNVALSMYPNPATDMVTLNFENGTIDTIEVYALSGVKVKETTNTTIDVSAFQAGVYFVQATTDRGVATKRLIIK